MILQIGQEGWRSRGERSYWFGWSWGINRALEAKQAWLERRHPKYVHCELCIFLFLILFYLTSLLIFWIVHTSLLLVLLPLFPWFDLKTGDVLYHVHCEASRDSGCTFIWWNEVQLWWVIQAVRIRLLHDCTAIVPDHGIYKTEFSSAGPNPSNVPKFSCIVHAQLIIDPIWKGDFSIYNENFDSVIGLTALSSSKACLKMCISIWIRIAISYNLISS